MLLQATLWKFLIPFVTKGKVFLFQVKNFHTVSPDLRYTATSVDACDPSPCQNNGACFNSQFEGEYFCDCVDGYTGDNCETGKLMLFCTTIELQSWFKTIGILAMFWASKGQKSYCDKDCSILGKVGKYIRGIE